MKAALLSPWSLMTTVLSCRVNNCCMIVQRHSALQQVTGGWTYLCWALVSDGYSLHSVWDLYSS